MSGHVEHLPKCIPVDGSWLYCHPRSGEDSTAGEREKKKKMGIGHPAFVLRVAASRWAFRPVGRDSRTRGSRETFCPGDFSFPDNFRFQANYYRNTGIPGPKTTDGYFVSFLEGTPSGCTTFDARLQVYTLYTNLKQPSRACLVLGAFCRTCKIFIVA